MTGIILKGRYCIVDQIGSGGDEALARLYAGDDARFIHDCNGGIGGAPGHSAIRSGPGLNEGIQCCGGTSEDAQGLAGELNVGDLVSGGIPIAAGGLFRNDQGRQLVGNDLIAVECGGIGGLSSEARPCQQSCRDGLRISALPRIYLQLYRNCI